MSKQADTSTSVTPHAGMTVRCMDTRGVHQGGGVVLSVDTLYVTVAQRWCHRHNGVVIDRGVTPTRYALSTSTFELA